VFLKSFSTQPINDCSQLDEAKKADIGFLITSANATKAFNALKEIFHLVPLAIIPPMMFLRAQAMASRWNTNATASSSQLAAKFIAVITFVRHGRVAPELGPALPGCFHVGPLARSQRQPNRPARAIAPRADLAVESAFGAAHRLMLLASGGVARVLMQASRKGNIPFAFRARALSTWPHSPHWHQRRQRV